MQHQTPNTAGTLKVSQEVIKTIVKQVIIETEGVQALTSLPVPAKDMVIKSGVKRSIKITLNGDVAMVDISVSIKIGYQVKTVAHYLFEKSSAVNAESKVFPLLAIIASTAVAAAINMDIFYINFANTLIFWLLLGAVNTVISSSITINEAHV